MGRVLKVSSRGRYAVKAVYELALHYDHGPVAVSFIAQAQGISEQYLEQLMPFLKRAHIIRGLRGAQGGYTLARAPRDISVSDVVSAVEGPILLTDCSSEAAAGCEQMDRCVGPDVWGRVQEAILDAMAAMTFQNLLEMQREQFRTRLALSEGRG